MQGWLGFLVVVAGAAGIVGSGCGKSTGMSRTDAGAPTDVAISSGGMPGTGGLTASVPSGGVMSTGGLTAGVPSGGVLATGGLTAGVPSGGAASGGAPLSAFGGVDAAGAAPSGGAGGAGGASAISRLDADVPDVPISGAIDSGGATDSGGVIASAGTTGTAAVTGGTPSSGGATGTGGSAGSGGATSPSIRPCDIYSAAKAPTPCVAAYSMVRVLSSAYNGPLYQVRKGGDTRNTGTGGTILDIGSKDGFADAATQDTFCSGGICTVSVLYDQSGNGNHLTVAKKGCAMGTAAEDDYESSATKLSLTVSGRKVYGLYMNAHEGYRKNDSTTMPTGSAAQGIYEVVDGRRFSSACCWEFGNGSTDACSSTGRTNALVFGAGWGTGPTSTSPFFLADFGGGPWIRDCGFGAPENPPCYPSVPSLYLWALGILKTNATTCSIRFGNALVGSLDTAYDGPCPRTLSNMQGGIILGIGADNTNSAYGTFFEGAITAGSPAYEIDDAIAKNIQAAGYGN